MARAYYSLANVTASRAGPQERTSPPAPPFGLSGILKYQAGPKKNQISYRGKKSWVPLINKE